VKKSKKRVHLLFYSENMREIQSKTKKVIKNVWVVKKVQFPANSQTGTPVYQL